MYNGFKNKALPINGVRPTPLRINDNSNVIHKKRASKKHSGPVIIYAVSPKVIHTRPEDFMALVQSLTGLESSLSGSMTEIVGIDQGCDCDDDGGSSSSGSDDHAIVDHISIKEESTFDCNNNIGCFLVSPTMFMPPSKASIRDIPLYTPTGRDWDL